MPSLIAEKAKEDLRGGLEGRISTARDIAICMFSEKPSQIIRYIGNNGAATRKEIRELTEDRPDKAGERINFLLSRGVMEATGKTYYLTEEDGMMIYQNLPREGLDSAFVTNSLRVPTHRIKMLLAVYSGIENMEQLIELFGGLGEAYRTIVGIPSTYMQLSHGSVYMQKVGFEAASDIHPKIRMLESYFGTVDSILFSEEDIQRTKNAKWPYKPKAESYEPSEQREVKASKKETRRKPETKDFKEPVKRPPFKLLEDCGILVEPGTLKAVWVNSSGPLLISNIPHSYDRHAYACSMLPTDIYNAYCHLVERRLTEKVTAVYTRVLGIGETPWFCVLPD